MISSEVESLARTGGLGDVVAALSLALAELGEEVLVVTPLYGATTLPTVTRRWDDTVAVRHGWGEGDVRHPNVVELEPARFPSGGSRRVCLLDDPALFARAGLYGDRGGAFGDNALRFAVMSRGALEISARVWEGGPDIIHAHDWHAAFAVLYARLVMGEHWAKKPSVFTVHNLAFQGVLDEGTLDRLHLPREAYRPEILWHQGNVNLMKGATALADRITTVSPTYAKEILTPELGFGLDEHLRAHEDKLTGILNGIDPSFDPRTDTAIARTFDATTASPARAECKAAIVKEVGLDGGEGPLFACVTRLTWQKGIDLLVPILGEIVERGGRVLVVGQGDGDLESSLLVAAERFHGKVAVRIVFDPLLSRRVYAGADFFFVPSRFEPCGLTQMYAMHYGAIPIVTNVGGLHDTVEPIDAASERGTGFFAAHADVPSLRAATIAAFELWRDRGLLVEASARGMAQDFSWSLPAERYRTLFAGVAGRF
ncbi:glycogen synthase GlgA [soil metagenome]